MANITSVGELERLKTLHNGEKQPLTFSDAEFERRLAGLRSIMTEQDLDAVILTSYQNIKYYSDFLFTYFGRSYALVVTQQESITITANIDAGMPWRTSYGDNIVYTDWQRDNFYYALQEALKRQASAPSASVSKMTPCPPCSAEPFKILSQPRNCWISPRPPCANA